jgi:hypothetical protein
MFWVHNLMIYNKNNHGFILTFYERKKITIIYFKRQSGNQKIQDQGVAMVI